MQGSGPLIPRGTIWPCCRLQASLYCYSTSGTMKHPAVSLPIDWCLMFLSTGELRAVIYWPFQIGWSIARPVHSSSLKTDDSKNVELGVGTCSLKDDNPSSIDLPALVLGISLKKCRWVFLEPAQAKLEQNTFWWMGYTYSHHMLGGVGVGNFWLALSSMLSRYRC